VRANKVRSPTCAASPAIWSTVTEAPTADSGAGRERRCADDAGRRVDGEVNAGIEHASRDQGHQRHEAFEQHRAVADRKSVAFARDQLGRGARGDQGVEAGDGAAGDGDEAEGEDPAGEDRAGAIDKTRERRHLQWRADGENADGEHQDHAEFDKRAEVTARRQQQPHGQSAGKETVAPGEPRRNERRAADPLAGEDGRQHQQEAAQRCFENFARTPIAQR
jgi:hypothetical protein